MWNCNWRNASRAASIWPSTCRTASTLPWRNTVWISVIRRKQNGYVMRLHRCVNSIIQIFWHSTRPSFMTPISVWWRHWCVSVAAGIRLEIVLIQVLYTPSISIIHTFEFTDLFSCTFSYVKGFPEILIALVIRDVLSGLDYLHRRGYVHRSIRASHILLCQTKAVLSGFRDCTSFLKHGARVKKLFKLPGYNTSNLNWLAPEVLEQNIIGYTEKSDIYSIGITCCELANGIEPYADSQPTYMLTEKVRGNIPPLLDRSTCIRANEMMGKRKTKSRLWLYIYEI